MPKEKIYLAYGSNLNLSQMAQRCPTAKRLGTAILNGYGLEFRGQDGHAVATIDPGPSSVPVLLWRIKPEDEERLDTYEGWPRLYRKETVDVELDGKPVSAMVYIMNDGYDLNMPDSHYLHSIREGYRSAGFDEAVLDAAVDFSRQAQEVHVARHNQVSEKFAEKLNHSFGEREAAWLQMAPAEIISKASYIVKIQQIYKTMQMGGYKKEAFEYLLQFEDPLEILDKWLPNEPFYVQGELNEMFDDVMEISAEEWNHVLGHTYTVRTEPELEL